MADLSTDNTNPSASITSLYEAGALPADVGLQDRSQSSIVAESGPGGFFFNPQGMVLRN